MKRKMYLSWLMIIALVVFTAGCDRDNEVKETPATEEIEQSQSLSDKFVLAKEQPETKVKKPKIGKDVAVYVDGKVLKKSQLEKQINDIMKTYQDQIPEDNLKEAKVRIKTQLIENFIIRTVLEDEIEKRKIVAEEKEINEAVDKIKTEIEPGQKFEEFLKANKMTREQLNENIASNIKIKKIVMLELGDNAKPTKKEIIKFYNDNKERFTIPESIHLRHILIAINDKDDEATKEKKKAKIEDLRKQIAEGSDFAEIAAKNSDCPSRESGGDLGSITRGQTVKPFEDAAFSQKVNVVGPVITTDYGYHIIEVLERNPEQKISLDEVKEQISDYLEGQKQQDAFASLMKRLRTKADIIVN